MSRTVKKVEMTSPKGDIGQRYLVSGKLVAIRRWEEEPNEELKSPSRREYETLATSSLAGRLSSLNARRLI